MGKGKMDALDRKMMSAAIAIARRGIAKGESPFGAVVVKRGKIIARAHNTVLTHHDPTRHAEINAISMAGKILKSEHLDGCMIYSTCEPCPMCFSAIHWARIGRIFYGARIADVDRMGFRELTISNEWMRKAGGAKVAIVGGMMRKECLALMDEWKRNPKRRTY